MSWKDREQANEISPNKVKEDLLLASMIKIWRTRQMHTHMTSFIQKIKSCGSEKLSINIYLKTWLLIGLSVQPVTYTEIWNDKLQIFFCEEEMKDSW